MVYFWAGIVAALAVAVAYLCWMFCLARSEVIRAPREEMVECHTGRHGPIPKKSALEVSELLPDRPVYLCPFCFQEAMKQARQSPPATEKRQAN